MRRLLNVLTILSLFLCVATAIAWVRSEFRSDSAYRFRERYGGPALELHSFSSVNGSLCYGYWFAQSVGKPPWSNVNMRWRVESKPAPARGQSIAYMRKGGFYFFGFGARRDYYPPASSGVTNQEQWAVLLPHWFVMILFALAPAHWTRTQLSGRRRQHGSLCAACGYDLRETAERCPECGKEVAQREAVVESSFRSA